MLMNWLFPPSFMHSYRWITCGNESISQVLPNSKRKLPTALGVEPLEDRTLLAGAWQPIGPAAQHDTRDLLNTSNTPGQIGQDLSGRISALAWAQNTVANQ
jgi:hypothetical protein